MQLIKRVFDFYVFGNIHVALAVFSLVKVTLLSNGIENNEVPIFTFFATILGYNFIRLYRKSANNSWLITWIEKNLYSIYAIVVCAAIGTLIFLFRLKFYALLGLIPFGIFTFFYAVPFSGKVSANYSLRTLAGLKIFLIAISWAGVTVLIPAIHHELKFSMDIVLVFIQRFLFVIAITLPFDIRDIAYDDQELKTLPQIFGIVNVKRFGLLLLMLFLGLNFFKNINIIDQNNLRIEFIIMLISLILLVKATPKQGKYYSAFLVEITPIIWGILVFLN